MKRARGFTLLELMAVVAIIAVLAGIAFNAYDKQLRKSRRSEAKQALENLALAEEKWRSNNAKYPASISSVLNGTPSYDFYTVAKATPTGNCNDLGTTAASSSNSFKVTATAKAGGPQTKDTACTAMVLTSKCGQVAKTPTTCW